LTDKVLAQLSVTCKVQMIQLYYCHPIISHFIKSTHSHNHFTALLDLAFV